MGNRSRREFVRDSVAFAALPILGGCCSGRPPSSDYSVSILGDTHFDAAPADVYHGRWKPRDERDLLDRRREFARNADMWVDRLYKYGKGESYGIPYRILCAKGVRNLLVAGRCVSTDQKVQASIRVMPACYLTGQAAGFAAAMAADGAGDVHAVDVPRLQGALAEFGAYLPNRA